MSAIVVSETFSFSPSLSEQGHAKQIAFLETCWSNQNKNHIDDADMEVIEDQDRSGGV